MELLKLLWNEMIQYGYNVRSKGKDGLVAWTNIKVLIPGLKITWTEHSKTIYESLLGLGVRTTDETYEASGITKEEWDRDHFLIQHGRIIKNNLDGTLVRLMQIAYNAGQFRAEKEKNGYNPIKIKYYDDNKLDQLETYITEPIELPVGLKSAINLAFAENLKGGAKKSMNFYLSDYLKKI
jgi:hypothetical protein